MSKNKNEEIYKIGINWYPGHMAKTKREIKERIKLIDIVIEIIDARIPKSSKIVDTEEYVKNKERILVFSKYDLCDKKITDKWAKYYESLGYKVLMLDLTNNNDYKVVIKEIENKMTFINQKRKERGLLPKKAKVLVIGVPNVGKSTLINKLTNKKIAQTGNKPGVTKALSWVKINEKIDLLDSPGILWPKFESEIQAFNLASMTIIKEEILPLDEVAIYILDKLNTLYKEKLKKLYNLEDFSVENIEEAYKIISEYRHINYKNGEIDYDKINNLIYNDIKLEKLKGITFDNL